MGDEEQEAQIWSCHHRHSNRRPWIAILRRALAEDESCRLRCQGSCSQLGIFQQRRTKCHRERWHNNCDGGLVLRLMFPVLGGQARWMLGFVLARQACPSRVSQWRTSVRYGEQKAADTVNGHRK